MRINLSSVKHAPRFRAKEYDSGVMKGRLTHYLETAVHMAYWNIFHMKKKKS